jgi:hypothetical protein
MTTAVQMQPTVGSSPIYSQQQQSYGQQQQYGQQQLFGQQQQQFGQQEGSPQL